MNKVKVPVRLTAVVLAVALLVHQPLVYADWASDWLGKKSANAPGYMAGQSRNYVSGGSFSARWPSDTWHPVSVQSPHINAGCGGIDFFGGNVSLLSPTMLVQKLENILQNSAGVAFDLALTTLCPSCSQIMKSMEALSSQLNSMSMNSCQAAKGLVVAAASESDKLLGGALDISASNYAQAGLGQTYAQFMSPQGPLPSTFGLSLPDFNAAINSNTGAPATSKPNLTGCSDPIIQVLFPSDDSMYPISVLSVVGSGVVSMPDSYVKLMRGLVGDIYIAGATQGDQIFYLPGCATNPDTMNIQDMLAGYVSAKDVNGNCTQDTAGTSINQYVTDKMTSISGKLSQSPGAATALTTEEYNFVDTLPLGVLYALRTGVASGQSPALISDLSGIVAAEWLELSLKDLLQRVTTIQGTLSAVQPNMVNGGTGCNLTKNAPGFKEAVEKLSTRTKATLAKLDDNLQTQLASLNALQQYTGNIRQLNDQIKTYVKNQYGPSVAARITRTIH